MLHQSRAAAITRAAAPPATMPPIAPVLKELEDCACTEVDASGEVTIVVATGMVIDVPEEGVELVPNGL